MIPPRRVSPTNRAIRRTATPLMGVLVTLLAACADYSFTVNEKLVYTPEPLFRDFEVPDAALARCLRQHITDADVRAAEQLKELNCSHAGVATLQGLEVFAHLVRLKLSNNQISDLAPLANMPALEELYLDNNALRSIMPLRGDPGLLVLDLGGNDTLVCAQLDYFRRQPGLELSAPAHCPAIDADPAA